MAMGKMIHKCCAVYPGNNPNHVCLTTKRLMATCFPANSYHRYHNGTSPYLVDTITQHNKTETTPLQGSLIIRNVLI